jgi:DNA-binding MarR family transcriptional regulator
MKKLSHRAKLSQHQVRTLVRVCAKHGVSQTALAKRFNTSQSAVNHILKGQTYTGALRDAVSQRYLVTIQKRYSNERLSWHSKRSTF